MLLGVLKKKTLQVLRLPFSSGITNLAPHAALVGYISSGSSLSTSNSRLNLQASVDDYVKPGLTPYNRSFLTFNFNLNFILNISANASGRIITFDDNGSGEPNLEFRYDASSGLRFTSRAAGGYGFLSHSVVAAITLNTSYNCSLKVRGNLLQLFLNDTLVISHTIVTPLYNSFKDIIFGGFGATTSATGFLDEIELTIV